MRAAAWFVLASALLDTTVAHACRCGGDTRVIPEDGAVGVPLDARLMVLDGDADSVTLRRQADGAPVALELEEGTATSRHYQVVLARPVEPLEPSTTYEVTVPDSGWFVSTFTTGVATDTQAPVFDGVTAVRPRRWRGGEPSSCDSGVDGIDDIVFDHAPLDADVVGAVLELRRVGDDSPAWRAILPGVAGRTTLVSSGYCSHSGAPILDDGASYCGRLTVFDVSGNTAGGDVEICGTAGTCLRSTNSLYMDPRLDCAPLPLGGGGCVVAAAPAHAPRAPWLVLLATLGGAIVLRRRSGV